ncbi:MAG: hypothetical protein AVDCRST_MAG30-339 [uncultured Solirubrobacteraceae bacterium]|uniref:Uncharacterized protein n=1 Tax=uncultured Solirubrobacteraceae bacterium TaxID=1162706 RepID=A0A6J4RJI0_9ACTN|nr:MAG: hypothetical protein AVDCRST_MAG30-339 [uncultured Solirubrobacteraceae bacterium]
MPPSSSWVARLVTVASVTAGLGLIGVSAGGVVAMDSELQAATQAPVPTRLVGEPAPEGTRGDWRCPRPDAGRTAYSPEV